MALFDIAFANLWNRALRLAAKPLSGGRNLGYIVRDERVTDQAYYVPHNVLQRHLSIVGLSGTGKTFQILNFILQDVLAGRSVIVFSHHNDLIPFCLKAIALFEKQAREDQARRLVLIEPGNPYVSPGLNVLSTPNAHTRFIRIAEIIAILREKFDLKTLGPRSEELARNAFYVASEAGLTIVDIPALLTNTGYLISQLKHVTNAEVREYFDTRFLQLSESMRAIVRDPLLNKISEYCGAPAFRHVLGQTKSTFSMRDALDGGVHVLIDLSKADNGAQGAALGSLTFRELQTAIFQRKSRELVSIYLDEVQNLVTADADLETLFVESRKFGCSVCISHQLLSQLPPNLRAAAQGAAIRLYFQLGADDAEHVARSLDGGQVLAQRLKNLPPRQFIVKSAHYPIQQVETPTVPKLDADYSHLLRRSRELYARKRSEIEAEIQVRRPKASATKEALDDWE